MLVFGGVEIFKMIIVLQIIMIFQQDYGDLHCKFYYAMITSLFLVLNTKLFV